MILNTNIEISTILRKKVLSTAFVFGVASFAFAQEKINVAGKIADQNNQAVPYASVTFSHTTNKTFSDATLTDEKGNYTISLAPGDYSVTIEAIDYKALTQNKKITPADRKIDFKIQKESTQTLTPTQNIEGVTITATSTKAYKVDIDKKVYDPSTDALSKGGNLQDVLTNVPSVEVDLDGTVSMRGSSNVRFLINGKPSSLLGLDSGANALQSIPADQIERIEVITNPSSKFEASGTAGILNIILKKSKARGFNGSVDGAIGYLPSSRLNANLNWRKGSWTWYMNGGGGQSQRKNTRTNNARYFDSNGSTTQTSYQDNDNRNDGKYYNFNSGFTVDITEKTSINLGGMIRYFENEGKESVNYLTRNFLLNTSENSTRLSNTNGQNTSMQGDFGIDHKLNNQGHNISASVSIQRSKGNDVNEITQSIQSVFNSKSLVNSETINNTFIGKLDYELPIGENSRLEAGYRIDRNENDYDYEAFKSTDNINYLIQNDFTSRTIYREMFNAGYAQFKSKINRLGYQIGLRVENSDIKVSFDNATLGRTQIDKNYTKFFPSVFLSYDLGGDKSNQLLLNYSRRINRPRSFFLVPFNSFNLNDDRNLFRGNPDLNPEYVNSFELGYAIQKKKFTINPTAYFRKVEDGTEVVAVRESANSLVLVSRPYNIGSEMNMGLDVNVTADVFPWWKVMANVDLYHYNKKGSFYDATLMDSPMSFDGTGFSGRGRLTNSFKVDKTFNIQVQGMLRGGEKTATKHRKTNYSFNLGATKTIWNGNGTIAFNIQDILNTRAMENITYAQGFQRDSYMQFMPRTFTLSLTYRFKQGDKVEQKKKKREESNFSGYEEQVMM